MTPTTQGNANLKQSTESQLSELEVLTAAVMQFLHSFTNNQGMGLKTPHIDYILDQFTQKHLSNFNGKLGALDTESWNKRIDKICIALFCTDEQKIEYAVFVLVDEANQWWTYAR